MRTKGEQRRADVEPETLAEGQAVEDNTAALVESLTMRDALNSLSPAHREVLVLAHYDSLAAGRDRRPARHPPRYGQDAHVPRAAGVARRPRQLGER